jgi:signal transduction histidine kinase
MEDSPSEIQISVKDNGMGIPKDKQKDLFKKFYQVDTTLTRERGGSGLGLAICRGIIDNHGGSISVQSQEGKGAKFTFSIPRQAIALA